MFCTFSRIYQLSRFSHIGVCIWPVRKAKMGCGMAASNGQKAKYFPEVYWTLINDLCMFCIINSALCFAEELTTSSISQTHGVRTEKTLGGWCRIDKLIYTVIVDPFCVQTCSPSQYFPIRSISSSESRCTFTGCLISHY